MAGRTALALQSAFAHFTSNCDLIILSTKLEHSNTNRNGSSSQKKHSWHKLNGKTLKHAEHIAALVDKLNTGQQCAPMAKQASSIPGCARQRAASRLKEMWSLTSTQHWGDTSGVLCPVSGSPEHVAESPAKGWTNGLEHLTHKEKMRHLTLFSLEKKHSQKPYCCVSILDGGSKGNRTRLFSSGAQSQDKRQRTQTEMQ